MKFMLLPWKPELVFTGTSIMGINPQTGKFSSHLVKFTSLASVKMINYETPTKIPVIFFLLICRTSGIPQRIITIFLLKVCGMQLSRYMFFTSLNFHQSHAQVPILIEVLLLQLRIYKTPDLETPRYQILKRTANYEVSLPFL